jgi:hypothetical protein
MSFSQVSHGAFMTQPYPPVSSGGKDFKFRGSLSWDCEKSPDKSLRYAILLGSGWVRRGMEEETSGKRCVDADFQGL